MPLSSGDAFPGGSKRGCIQLAVVEVIYSACLVDCGIILSIPERKRAACIYLFFFWVFAGNLIFQRDPHLYLTGAYI